MIWYFPNLHSILAPVFALMQPELPPDLPELFPTDAYSRNPVKSYFGNIVTGGRMDSLRKSSIVKMEYCKRDKEPWHEFIIAIITYPETSHLATLKVERTADVSSHASTSNIVSSPGSQAASDGVTVAGTSGPEIMLEKKTDPYTVLSTLRFPNSHPVPSVVDLATALTSITNFKQSYNLYDGQCYWFSLVTWKVMQNLFNGTESAGKRSKSMGKYGHLLAQKADGVDEISKITLREMERLRNMTAANALAQKNHEDELRELGRREALVGREEELRRIREELKAAKLVIAEQKTQLAAVGAAHTSSSSALTLPPSAQQ